MNLTAVFNYLIGGHTEHRAWLFLDVHSDKTQWTQAGAEKILKKLWKTFLLWAWSLQQVPQRGCGLSAPADIQNLTGHGPQQSDLVGLLWVGGWTRLPFRGSFQLEFFLWFYSVFKLFEIYSRLFLLSFKASKMIFEDHFQTHTLFCFVLLGHIKHFSKSVYIFWERLKERISEEAAVQA